MRWLAVSLIFSWIYSLPATGQTLPQYFSRVAVGGTINSPSVMAFAPDGRIFVAEQSGTLYVIKDGVQLSTPFITLTVNSFGERGLIGITFDPDFTTNHHIYLYYTTATGGLHNRISRFTANGDVVLAGSEQIILELDPLTSATNHNGGALAFGADGKLYVAIGENANGAHSQDLDTYHGKLLRINKDGSAPEDNPFPEGTNQKKRVWAYGLRNPYTFSIHPATGRILVNDVGQGSWEEINDATAGGKNFGWPATEGLTSNPNYTSPIHYYRHVEGTPTGCAITGGTFFSPANTNYPADFHNKYFFMDYCNNWIYYFDPAAPGASTAFATNIGGASINVSTGSDGNLYYLSRIDKKLYKIVYNLPAQPPVITEQPESITVVEGTDAVFSVTAAGTEPITYQWYKDSELIDGATAATLTIGSATEDDEGSYHVFVSNEGGNLTSNEVNLLVSPEENAPPVAAIVIPATDDTYRAGTTISFEGTGADPEQGELDASVFSWDIQFHHDTHMHDQPAITGVTSGTFDVPNRGETSANVWYRFILTVTDMHGLSSKDTVDVHPLTSELTFETVPPGIEITIDGQPYAAPVTITSVEGLERDIVYTNRQRIDGVSYELISLSHGDELEQTIVTPQEDEIYTATYAAVTGLNDAGRSLILYPNPANAWVHISNRNVTSVHVVNSIGKSTSLTPVHNGGETLVDVSQLSPGVYEFFYAGDRGWEHGKIMISR